MTRISSRIGKLAESQTLAVDVKVQKLTAEGRDIVNLSAGQPDFPTPAHVCDAAVAAMRAGQTRYTPPGGTPALRAAAAAYFTEKFGVPADPASTVVSCGAKHSLHAVMMALLEPGDEVLLPVPYWVSYPEQVKLAEGVPVPVEPSAWLRVTPADLERARTPRTRLLVFNSPNNPTGQVYPRHEVLALAAYCREHGIVVLSDEIYNRLVFEGEAVSPAALGPEYAENTITVNGVSKSHAMTGWRIGIMTGPAPLMKAVAKFQGQTTGNPASISQAAALAALTGPDEDLDRMREAYRRRRDLAVKELHAMPGVELHEPQGAFYAFPRVTEASRAAGGSIALAGLLVEAGVAVVPGAAFGAEDHLRLSFALGDDRLAEGLRRLDGGLRAVAAGRPVASQGA